MALIVQTNDGNAAGANAYITLAFFTAYHADRGNAIPGTPTDAQKEQAIIRATDYLDQRFIFVGRRLLGRDQTTEWPRMDAWDLDRNLVTGIPLEVQEACAEYALRALTAELNPDPSRDASGAAIQSQSQQVGPIAQSVTFVSGAVFTMPKYPAADAKLRRTGLVRSGGTVLRA
ncbi:head-tail adaptor [Stenotrophomonas phage vB_SmaS_Bhz59]